MPYFLILADDHPNALDRRLANRQEHIAYWTGKPGVTKVAGAMLSGEQPSGSALLVEAEDEAAASALIAEDPFSKCGVFAGTPRIIAVRPAIGDWLPQA